MDDLNNIAMIWTEPKRWSVNRKVFKRGKTTLECRRGLLIKTIQNLQKRFHGSVLDPGFSFDLDNPGNFADKFDEESTIC